MIEVSDSSGMKRYLAADAIAEIREPSVATAWHGIRAIIRTHDGRVIEAREYPDAILAQMQKPAEAGAAQPATAEPGRDELSMALCAIRYCMGRRSYIVSDGLRWARHYGRISPWVRSVVIQDIETEARRIDRAREEGMQPFASLGDAGDERDWRAVLADLKALEAGDAR